MEGYLSPWFPSAFPCLLVPGPDTRHHALRQDGQRSGTASLARLRRQRGRDSATVLICLRPRSSLSHDEAQKCWEDTEMLLTSHEKLKLKLSGLILCHSNSCPALYEYLYLICNSQSFIGHFPNYSAFLNLFDSLQIWQIKC